MRKWQRALLAYAGLFIVAVVVGGIFQGLFGRWGGAAVAGVLFLGELSFRAFGVGPHSD